MSCSALLIKVPSYSDVISPPLGIGYLAAAVRDIAQVRVVDGVKTRLTVKGLANIIREFQHDIIGLSVVSAAFANAVSFIKAARAAAPASVIIAGGPHPSAMPDSFYDLSSPDLDYIIRGDGEQSFRMIVKDFHGIRARNVTCREIDGIPGIHARTRDGLVSSPIEVCADCNSPEMTAWDLMPPGEYPRAPHGGFFPWRLS